MGNTIYKVIETHCYPCAWFGGPTFNDAKLSQSPLYYWRTKEEAQSFCDKMNRKQWSK